MHVVAKSIRLQRVKEIKEVGNGIYGELKIKNSLLLKKGKNKALQSLNKPFDKATENIYVDTLSMRLI